MQSSSVLEKLGSFLQTSQILESNEQLDLEDIRLLNSQINDRLPSVYRVQTSLRNLVVKIAFKCYPKAVNKLIHESEMYDRFKDCEFVVKPLKNQMYLSGTELDGIILKDLACYEFQRIDDLPVKVQSSQDCKKMILADIYKSILAFHELGLCHTDLNRGNIFVNIKSFPSIRIIDLADVYESLEYSQRREAILYPLVRGLGESSIFPYLKKVELDDNVIPRMLANGVSYLDICKQILIDNVGQYLNPN